MTLHDKLNISTDELRDLLAETPAAPSVEDKIYQQFGIPDDEPWDEALMTRGILTPDEVVHIRRRRRQ